MYFLQPPIAGIFWSLGRAQFATGLFEDFGTSPHRQSCHDARHNQIGPRTAGAENANRCRQHGDITDRVVARTDPRYRNSIAATARFTARAREPMAPIVPGSGDAPTKKPQMAEPSTHRPKASMVAAFTRAARARQTSAMPATPRLIA